MTELEIRQFFVDSCCSYMGYNEADGSHKKIIDLYNTIKPLPIGYKLSYNDPWCAGFVSAMGKKCGMQSIIFPECGCDRMIAAYKAKGRWREANYTPQLSDLIFYDWDRSGTADHVGVVVSVSGLTLKVIEGNVSNAVGYRNIVVGDKYIKGFALPDFASLADKDITDFAADVPVTNVGNTKPTSTGVGCSIQLPILKIGSTGNSVKALQILLIGNGHSCGSYGADGEFGSKTQDAVIGLQESKGLTKDGIAGKDTWSAILI